MTEINKINDLDSLSNHLSSSEINSSYTNRRKFSTGDGDTYSLNSAVQQLSQILKKHPESDEKLVRSIVGRIQELDSNSNESHLNRFFTRISQFFGNLFYDRNAKMAQILGNLPPALTEEQPEGIQFSRLIFAVGEHDPDESAKKIASELERLNQIRRELPQDEDLTTLPISTEELGKLSMARAQEGRVHIAIKKAAEPDGYLRNEWEVLMDWAEDLEKTLIDQTILKDPYLSPHLALPQQDLSVIGKDTKFTRNPDIKKRLVYLAGKHYHPGQHPQRSKLDKQFQNQFCTIAISQAKPVEDWEQVEPETINTIYSKLEKNSSLDETDRKALENVRKRLVSVQDRLLHPSFGVQSSQEDRKFLYDSNVFFIKLAGLLEDHPTRPTQEALLLVGWPETGSVFTQVLENRKQYNPAPLPALIRGQFDALISELKTSRNPHIARELASHLGIYNTIRLSGPSKGSRPGTLISKAQLDQFTNLRDLPEDIQKVIQSAIPEEDPLNKDWNSLMEWGKNLDDDLNTLAKNLPSVGSPPTPEQAVTLKKFWRDAFLSPLGRTLDLNSDRRLRSNLKQAHLYNTIADDRILVDLVNAHRTHHTALVSSPHAPNTALIEGAGPTGLLMALTQYEQGMNVDLREKRAQDYTREQMVRLDPIWMGHLEYLLGNEFDRLFTTVTGFGTTLDQARGRFDTNTRAGFIQIKELEIALAKRAQEIADLDPEGFKITYSSQIDEVKVQNGSFVAQTSNPKTKEKSEESLGDVDIIFTCGGKKSPTAETLLSKPVAQTMGRYYGISVWKIRYDPQKNLRWFRDFRGFIRGVELQRKLLGVNLGDQALTEQLRTELAKEPFIEIRTFENRGEIYLASEMPKCLESVLEDPEVSKDKKEEIQRRWFKAIGAILEVDTLNNPNVLRDATTLTSFPVVQQALPETSHTYEAKDGHNLQVVAAGDSLVSPHFMSASGLSSARHVVDASTQLIKDLRNAKSASDASTAQEIFNQATRDAQDYALFRGKPFLNGLSEEEIEEARKKDLTEELEKAKLDTSKTITIGGQGYMVDGLNFPNLFALKHYLNQAG